jgi:class 3 adenylate cyclase
VLVSQTVRDLVAGAGLELTERGERQLKGVPGTWRLYAVADVDTRALGGRGGG